MRALKIVGKVIGWIALSALLLVVSTLLTVVIVGRTDWGHRKILSIALPQIQKQLAGRLDDRRRRRRSDARRWSCATSRSTTSSTSRPCASRR